MKPLRTEDLGLRNFRDIAKTEELPMEILEEKEVDHMNVTRSEIESDHMYCTSEGSAARHNLNNEKCMAPLDSEESQDLLMSGSNDMEIN